MRKKVFFIAGAKALATLAEETSRRYAELVRQRKAGELLYRPDPSDLHTWELRTTRRDAGWGRGGEHSWTGLYVSRDVAFRAAAETAHGWFKEWGHGDVADDRVKTLYADGRYEEMVEYVSSQYSTWSFQVRCVPIKSNPNVVELSEYDATKEEE